MKEEKSICLTDYVPKSELVTEEHYIHKAKFPVLDIHSHFGTLLLGDDYADKYDTAEVVELLKQHGIKGIVNLDGFWGTELDNMLKKIHPYEDFIMTFGAVDVSRLEDKDFETYVYRTLLESKQKGIRGLKFWKIISLVMKDSKNKYIGIDDKRLKVIWETAAELKLPVLLHIADPIAFFKPIDRFNERYEELLEHPDWSFCAPELYSFEQLMDMQENLIASNPETTFIIAHGGSFSENLGYVGKCLDKYPNMYVDIAARIAEFGRQPYTSRKFFNKYADRILFGTDMTPLGTEYPISYRFLETWDEYFDYSSSEIPPQGRWKIYGIGLEDKVLEKIYHLNAEKLLSL
jgi:predicted TIM-barrel fold metal-dependent hydrolase